MFDLFELLRFALIPNAVTYILLSVFIVAIAMLLLSRKFKQRWLWVITFVIELATAAISVILLMHYYKADDLVRFSASLCSVISFTILISITIILLFMDTTYK